MFIENNSQFKFELCWNKKRVPKNAILFFGQRPLLSFSINSIQASNNIVSKLYIDSYSSLLLKVPTTLKAPAKA